MERFFRRLGLFIETRRRVIIIVGLILIAVSLFGAMRITMATGIETWVSTDSQTYKDYERFNEHFGSSAIVVMVTGDDLTQLLQPDNLTAMEAVETQMGANPGVISAIGPTFLIKQAVVEQTGTPVLPDAPQALQTIVIDPQSGQIRPAFEDVLPDDKHALISIVLEGGMSRDEEKVVVEETERAVAGAGFVGVEAVVTGAPVVTSKVQSLMASSMRNMFIVAIFLMFLVLALIFRVRGFFAWRWLAMGEVGLAIIYTFGAMGLLNVPITMVTMAVFPILIGLGVDYSIQLHNRYDEETGRGKTLADAVIDTVTHIGPSMGIALIAMCLGFAALLFSPVPMIRDFGLMLIIGVIACYIVAMFFPLAILYWRDRRAGRRPPAKERAERLAGGGVGLVERGLQRLAPWVIKYPAIIIPIALALSVGGLIGDPHIETETDWTNLFSEDVAVVKNYQTLMVVVGVAPPTNVLVEAEDITDPEILTWMLQFEDRISTELAENIRSTNSVADLVLQANGGRMPQTSDEVIQILENVPRQLRRNLVSDDYCAANVVVGIMEFDLDRMKQLRAQLIEYASDRPPGVNVAVTGADVLNVELFNAMSTGRSKMTLIGVGFIFLGLFFLFRFSLLKAFLATLPIALIIGWSSGLMYLSGMQYNPLTATMGALILAIGVEYTILLMRRYYEERGKGARPREAMTTAMTKIGRAIIASGLTDIAGFAALLAATDFLMLRDFGMMTVINVFLALVSTLVVLPTLVVWVDSWRERRRSATVRDRSDSIAPE
jgi:hydrophobe/amphiphile efflux-3 (HAE3) family protein